MTEDLHQLDAGNELLEEQYNRDNIIVKDIGRGSKCFIFFSSNDIYYPNTIEVFRQKIVVQDRYEWINMARSPEILNAAGRYIFVRDLYKQWYITGVNSRISSPDLLAEELRRLAEGYTVITVGSSAGGYAAALYGALLNAQACFDFSGQLELGSVNEDFCLRKTGRKPSELKYYDIRGLMKDSACDFYYFYPYYHEKDRGIYNSISGLPNVYGFGFNQRNHAASMMAGNMRFIVCKDKDYMDKLYERYKGKIINNILFFFRTAPFHMWFPIGMREAKMFIKRRIGKG
ncbi:MAG: hypothetical protein K6E53_03820 [Lachnospiraceae bacterium]|nr:hypothetical protein [Lachnospiraceae bacterium]